MFLCETLVASGLIGIAEVTVKVLARSKERKVTLPHSKHNKAALALFTFHNNGMAAHYMCKLDAWSQASTKEHPV